MGDKPDLLEACGEGVGIFDTEERVRQGHAGGYYLLDWYLQVDGDFICRRFDLFMVVIQLPPNSRRNMTNRTAGRRNLDTANGNVWRSKPLPKTGWAVSNGLARWQVNWAHHSERQSDRNDLETGSS
jgi:hypothetical protein